MTHEKKVNTKPIQCQSPVISSAPLGFLARALLVLHRNSLGLRFHIIRRGLIGSGLWRLLLLPSLGLGAGWAIAGRAFGRARIVNIVWWRRLEVLARESQFLGVVQTFLEPFKLGLEVAVAAIPEDQPGFYPGDVHRNAAPRNRLHHPTPTPGADP